MPPKVLLVTNIPTPYRIPLFNELHRQLDEKGMQLIVAFGALGYGRRKWRINTAEFNFRYTVLDGGSLTFNNTEKTSFAYSGLFKLISSEKPDVVISNGFSIATTKLWIRSWVLNTPYIIWSGTVRRYRRAEYFVRTIQRKLLVKAASAYIAYGTKARAYLISLGANPAKVFIGINTVDTKFFCTETEKHRRMDNQNKTIKKVLYIGNLTKGKRIDNLLVGIKQLALKRHDFILEVVGAGEEELRLKSITKDLGIDSLVTFNGFKQIDDIPKYLAGAECFAFPSEYDIWGLVLVEAMAAGLPCIASIHAGATSDLIKDNETGFRVDFNDEKEVAEKINLLFENKGLSRRISMNARRFIRENITLQKSAMGFVDCIEHVLGNR